MKLMCPAMRLPLTLFVSILLIFGLSGTSFGQRKKAQSKKPEAKKTVAKAKDAKKDTRKSKATAKAKDTRRDSKRDSRRDAKRDSRSSKRDKQTARSNSRDRRDRNAKDDRNARDNRKLSKAERRKAEAERRREEAARRAAILAEIRRREELARQARERRLAFERGLHTATQENISKDSPDGEDLRIRTAAVSALGSRAGTVVVMEAQTGKIVTMVNQDWALHDGFKPCSTIKLVTGVAGLSENVITSDGSVTNASTRFKLDDAVAFSDNGYFQRVGSNLGNSKMISYAKTLGLGEPTGINADREYAGKLPYGNSNPRIYSHGDDFEVTPLQLAVLVSEIANGGKKVVPQIAKGEVQNTSFRSKFRPSVALPQQDLQGMLPGMIGAAQYGTAHRGVDAGLGIAGKTGSCIGKGSWVGLFTSVAPVENPKYAVVVITRGQGERGKYAAAVAGRIYQALSPQLKRDPSRYQALMNLRPRTQVDAQTAAKLAAAADEDDEDANSDADNATQGQPTWVPPAKRSGEEVIVNKPLIKRTVDSRPTNQPPANATVNTNSSNTNSAPTASNTAPGPKTFPPVVITFKKDKDDEQPVPAGQRPRIVKNN
jgi:transpeptidase family protein